MKKLMVMLAAVAMAGAAQAYAVNWKGTNIYAPDGSGNLYTGSVAIWGYGASDPSYAWEYDNSYGTITGGVTDGVLDVTFSVDGDRLVAGNVFKYYIVIKDGATTFDSSKSDPTVIATYTALGTESENAQVDFGDFSAATGGPVPEPTSGLLLLVGGSLLALRRKCA